ncbi:MAG: hypothetical protein KDD06_13570 [Phaeodactylibacter sp.]|nr:hypothetical protein [Phaeodactylibacter sp.]MCB9263588.1 hypothetical protein [Lewinellaceae bacterium]MCB9287535.1 hypothetical protein [Lewinellaceae bacterium]
MKNNTSIRKMRVLAAFLSLSFVLQGQSFDTYLAYIHTAERNILSSAYEEALSAYDTAFIIWERPLPADIRNALQCAVLTEDTSEAYRHVKSLILLGCDLNFFFRQESLRAFRASASWRRIIEEYPALRSTFVQNCDWPLRSRIESLVARDQFWRAQDPHYTSMRDSTFAEDARIMDEVLEIFHQGYPTAYEIGVFMEEDTLLSRLDPLHLILLHNYTKADNYKTGPDLTETLLAFARQGRLHPDAFTYLNSRSGAYQMQPGFARDGVVWKADGKLYFEKINPERKDAIDQMRASIGLCTVEEMRKKALFLLGEKVGGFQFFHAGFMAAADLPAPMLQQFFVEAR